MSLPTLIFIIVAKRNYKVLVRVCVCVFPCVCECFFCPITQKVIGIGREIGIHCSI